MAFANRAELDTELTNWLNRSDLASRYDRFITLVESDYRGKLFHRKQLVRSSTTLFAGDEYLRLPPDFIKAHIFLIETNDYRHQLQYLTQSQLIVLYPKVLNGLPTSYSIVGNEIWIHPKPDRNVSLELNYFQRVPSLNDFTNNWLFDAYPDVYFYGMMAVANKAIRSNEEAVKYQTLYENALAAAITDGVESSRGGGPLQITTDSRSY